MNELYAEAGVRVRPPFKSVFLKTLLIVGIVFSFIMAILFQSPFFAPVAGILVVVAMYAIPRLSKVEYEYIFCDGQFDFDRITGGSKRKTLLKIDMENVDVIVSPDRIADFDNTSIKNIKDFSDSRKDAFVMITSGENGQMKVYFKPTEKMIECMYNKAPSKVKK